MNKKVSVLMPLYNAEAYVAETLECLLHQDYENIEVIVVDDGSKDKSHEAAKAYERDSRLTVVQQPNSGACVARNRAFELCTGDYVMYLDADDLITNDQIVAQVALLEDAPEGTMAFGRWARFYGATVNGAKIEEGTIYHDYDRAADVLADMWNGGGMMPIHSYIIPKKIIGDERFDTRLKVNQDGEFLCRILMRAKGLKYCDKGIAYYRSGISDSISSKKTTHEKGESLLLASQLCVKNIGDLKYDEHFAKGLANLFCGVAYQYQHFKDIRLAAHKEVMKLCVDAVNPAIGSTKFRKLCNFFGFWRVLSWKNLINL